MHIYICFYRMSERLLRFWLNNTGHDPGQKTDALNSFLPLRPALNAFNSCNVEYYQKNNTIILIRYSDIYRILYIFLIFYTYLNYYFLPDIYIEILHYAKNFTFHIKIGWDRKKGICFHQKLFILISFVDLLLKANWLYVLKQ